MKEPISQLKIEKPIISVFASGLSVLQLSNTELEQIHNKSYTIFINYALTYFDPKYIDALFFSDKKVSIWLSENIIKQNKPITYKLISRNEAFTHNKPYDIFQAIDYFFELKKDKIYGNYSLPWLLQLIQKYFPKKEIMIFGLDMKAESNETAKYYDCYTGYDYLNRGQKYDIGKKLDQCAEQLKIYIKQHEHIYNCNLDSGFNYFKKKDWKSI